MLRRLEVEKVVDWFVRQKIPIADIVTGVIVSLVLGFGSRVSWEIAIGLAVTFMLGSFVGLIFERVKREYEIYLDQRFAIAS